VKVINHIDVAGAADKIREAAGPAIGLAVEAWLTDANEHVPHDEGTLERSGESSVDEGQLRGAVSYDTPYAVRQHEDLTLQHQGKGEPKWLENTGTQNGGKYAQVIATAIKSEVER
jgi:hypothetical protein